MVFVDIAQLVGYINSNIKSNGVGSITGSQLNTALLGILQFLQYERTIVVELQADDTTIFDSRLIGASSLKLYSSVRLVDNAINNTSYTDGYTFNKTNGTITFAGIRGKGEVFVIDYVPYVTSVTTTTTTTSTTTTTTTL